VVVVCLTEVDSSLVSGRARIWKRSSQYQSDVGSQPGLSDQLMGENCSEARTKCKSHEVVLPHIFRKDIK